MIKELNETCMDSIHNHYLMLGISQNVRQIYLDAYLWTYKNMGFDCYFLLNFTCTIWAVLFAVWNFPAVSRPNVVVRTLALSIECSKYGFWCFDTLPHWFEIENINWYVYDPRPSLGLYFFRVKMLKMTKTCAKRVFYAYIGQK